MSRAPRVHRRLARLASGAALAACLLGLAEGWATAQDAATSSDALAAGRALFAEALGDEQAGRFRAALEKFERVRGIKDTASIEYRVGTCHEGLGQPSMAYRAYRASIALGDKDPSMADVVRAARERLDALNKHLARLTLVLPEAPPSDMSVQVDDVPLGRDALNEPVALEPGTHSVVAGAAGRVPFRSQIALPEGGEASLPVVLGIATATVTTPQPAESAAPGDGSHRTLGWVLLAAGGGLLAGSGTILLLRHGDIASLEAACPGGTCPASRMAELNGTHDRALAEGPIAAGLGAGGLAAAGLGVYFLLASPSSIASPGPVIAPALRRDGLGMAVSGTFR